MTTRSFPSRHKAQQEEEDAAALKLGPGTSEDALTNLPPFHTATHSWHLQNSTTPAAF
jgi:hypothetical protein